MYSLIYLLEDKIFTIEFLARHWVGETRQNRELGKFRKRVDVTQLLKIVSGQN